MGNASAHDAQYAAAAVLRAERRPAPPILMGKLATLCATCWCTSSLGALPRASTSPLACRGRALPRMLPTTLAALFGRKRGPAHWTDSSHAHYKSGTHGNGSPEFFFFPQPLLSCRFMELQCPDKCPVSSRKFSKCGIRMQTHGTDSLQRRERAKGRDPIQTVSRPQGFHKMTPAEDPRRSIWVVHGHDSRPQYHEKTPRERERKRGKMGVEEGKTKFWAPTVRPPTFWAPTLLGPHLAGPPAFDDNMWTMFVRIKVSMDEYLSG